MASNDLCVVYCPGRVHKEPAPKAGESRSATPKILFLYERGLEGRILIQCGESRCRHSEGEKYNGWYEVNVKATGAYTIEPVTKRHFNLARLPGIVLEGAW
jgi:hypothetical protein